MGAVCPYCGLIGGHRRGEICPAKAYHDALKKYDRQMAALQKRRNAEIRRGNNRRRHCAEKILEYIILEDKKRIRVWITKLVSAGFSSKDGTYFENLIDTDLKKLEDEVRTLLGVKRR